VELSGNVRKKGRLGSPNRRKKKVRRGKSRKLDRKAGGAKGTVLRTYLNWEWVKREKKLEAKKKQKVAATSLSQPLRGGKEDEKGRGHE